MKLTLPKSNLTKPKSGHHNIEQLCVIENTIENKKAIRHINKLAKQQGSCYKIVSKFRCAIDKKKMTDYGSLKSKNASGIGLYIKKTKNALNEDRKRELRYVAPTPSITEDHKEVLYKLARLNDKYINLKRENSKLKKLLNFEKLTLKQKAIFLIDKQIKQFQDNGLDTDYFQNDIDWNEINIEINTIIDNLKKER